MQAENDNIITVSSSEPAAQVQAETSKETKSASTHEVENDETQEESEASKDESNDLEESESDDQEESKEETDKPKKVGGFQKKINKMTKKLSDKDREIEYLKGLVAKTGSQESKAVEVNKVEAAPQDGKPNPDDFESHADWMEAVADWKYDLREKSKEEKSKVDQVKLEYQEAKKAHQKRVGKFKEQTKDFDSVVSEFIEEHGDLSFSLTVEAEIISSDLGPAIIYEFAKNPDEFKRINSLGPIAAARELGKIEARLSKSNDSSEEKKETKKLTKAPPPMAPVGSKGAGSSKKSIYDPDISQSEYEQLRRELQAKRA